jgi:tight adherence protein B
LTESLTFWGALLLVFASATLIAWAVQSVFRQTFESYRESFTSAATDNLADMFLFVDPQRLFLMNLGALVLIPPLFFLLTGDVLFTLAVVLVLLVLPPYVYRRMRAQRLKRFEQQLPDALTMISGSLRAGASLQIALQATIDEQPAPLSQEFGLFQREQRVGTDFGVALDHLEERVPIADVQMLGSALRISRDVGGNLAETLESLSETLRRKHAMEGKIDSLTAQGRMQAIVMACLPVLLAVLLQVIEPEAMSQLYTTPIGWTVLTVAIIWEALGFMFISRVVSVDV